MAATRFHHFGNSVSLPDASLAVFFLAGLWFSQRFSLFIVLLLEAGLIDYIAITHFSVSDFCISPAYLFLIPSYAALWFGGRFSINFVDQTVTHLITKFTLLIGSISVAFLISNGSFYLLSDKFTQPSDWAGYLSGIVRYYPAYLQYSVIYVVAIYALYLLMQQIMRVNSKENLSKI